MEPLLCFDRVSMRYHAPSGETLALEDFTLTIDEGEFVALLGPSGCGKSTVLSLAAGLLAPTSGEIRLRGLPITGPSREMGYMLQSDALFSWLTVRQNACLGLDVRGLRSLEADARVDALLAGCGLADFNHAFPKQLSGGMRQRVALVRTLAMNPSFLLLDEPFSALDAQTRLQLADEVKRAITASGRAALLVSHDISECISMADRVVVLSRRPARIQEIVPIHLQGAPMERRTADGFRAYFDYLWKELDVHG